MQMTFGINKCFAFNDFLSCGYTNKQSGFQLNQLILIKNMKHLLSTLLLTIIVSFSLTAQKVPKVAVPVSQESKTKFKKQQNKMKLCLKWRIYVILRLNLHDNIHYEKIYKLTPTTFPLTPSSPKQPPSTRQ